MEVLPAGSVPLKYFFAPVRLVITSQALLAKRHDISYGTPGMLQEQLSNYSLPYS